MLTNPADFCNFMIFGGLTMVIPSVIYRHCLQDVGGQVIEHTSCAVLSQDHNAVFCPLAMDYTPAIVVGSFLSGWLSRDWISTKPEVPACQCVCNWTGEKASTGDSGHYNLTWLLGFFVLLFALVTFSNAALALRVSYQDSSTGANREWQVGVKGKSKGVFNSAKGLAITG